MSVVRIISISSLLISSVPAQTPVGPQGAVGSLTNAREVSRLEITKPGVYENYRVNAQGRSGNVVKITASDVVLRHCEIFNSSGNGVGVFGTKVVIENCRIHHMLAGTFKDQHDAHGITGRWGDVTIRNCDISHCSGDCIQFDPDRASRGSLVIENCHLWTGPLPADAAKFKAGERPGENAFDSKTPPDGDRCRLVIRNSHLHGFNQPAQISTTAALNIKENVYAEIIHCVLADNEVSFRVRGPGTRGGAHVIINDCAVYDSGLGVRAEDKIEVLRINGLRFGSGVAEQVRFVNGRPGAGVEIGQGAPAPSLETLLKDGFR